MLYWVLKTILIGPVVRALWRPWIRGAENLPASGGAILASNHQAVTDSLFLPLMIPRRLTFPAKMEYFTGRGFKGSVRRRFLFGIGQVPLDRNGGAASRTALSELEKVLDRGELVGFYPEGTRSPDGRLYRGKTGIARLALATGVPVIPIAMVNTREIQPIGRIIPRLRPRPGIVVGKPLDFSRYEGMAGDRFVERSMTDEILYELMQLAGQEYVDVYAAKVRAELAREGRTDEVAARAAAKRIARRGDDAAERAPSSRAS
ncbi:MAG: lysophospholipid acyltransferase family protein [Mycobacteriales bacterium]